MARRAKTPELAAPQGVLPGATPAPKAARVPGLETRMQKTSMKHIYYFDVEGDGRFREVAVVMAAKNAEGSVQSIYFIDIALLDNIDKGRLKTLVTGQHADKYPLWELMSQQQLNNGKNALDYFHQLVKTVHGPGATNTSLGGGLAGVRAEGTAVIGSEFSDPQSAALEGQPN